MLFPAAPNVLDRVEFWRVSGQALQFEPGPLAGDPVLDQAAAVSGKAVPDDQQPARDMTQEMSQKLDHLGTANGSRKEAEVETPPGYPGHRREQLPVEMILQQRGLSARRPSAAAVGSLAQPALVDEDDGLARPAGFFLKLRPAVPLPALDGFFVTLQRAAGRPLATPAQLSQQAPDVRRMVAHPAQLLDQSGDPQRRPQCGLVAECLRSAFERLLDCLPVCRTQLGLASGAPGPFQPGPARLPQLADPANPRLPMDPQAPRYFGLAHALLQQLGRRHPAPLQALKVPLHPSRITHSPKLSYVSILCKSQ